MIAAWKFGGPEQSNVPGLDGASGTTTAKKHAVTPSTKGTARITIWANGGDTSLQVYRGALSGKVLYTRHAGAGPDAALHRRPGRGPDRPAGERARRGQRRACAADAPLGDVPRHPERPGSGRRADVRRPRAAIVVTGSELVRGERTDLNGPFSRSRRCRSGSSRRGSDRRRRPGELEEALREGLQARTLCSSRAASGRRTTTGRSSSSRASPAAGSTSTRARRPRSRQVSRMVAERLRRPYADFAPGVRKQATLPEGAVSLGLAGTAPGSRARRRTASRSSSCPGRRGSCSGSGPARSRRSRCSGCSRARRRPSAACCGFFGASESAVARALADAGGDGDGVEATICARDFEIHVDLIVEPGAEARADALARRCASRSPRYLFAEDERRSRSSCSSSAASAG